MMGQQLGPEMDKDAKDLKEPLNSWLLIAPVLAALLLVWYLGDSTPAQRFVNMDVSSQEIPEQHIVFSKTEPGRCFLGGRKNSNIRRDEKKFGGKMRHCQVFSQETAIRPTYQLRSRRSGTTFLVPASELRDWTFPFFYESLIEKFSLESMPRTKWVRLYVNQQFKGVYFQTSLPFKKLKEKLEKRPTEEIIAIQEGRLQVLNWHLVDGGRLLTSAIAEGKIPKFRELSDAQQWLMSHRPYPEMYGFIDEADVFTMQAMPTPASLIDVYLSKYSESGPVMRDDRSYGYFKAGENWKLIQFENLYDSEEILELRNLFKAYSQSLVLALGLQQDYLEQPNRLLEAWNKRSGVAHKIGWMPEGS
jgi:hypothetical protein